jgi:hypothetical protein
MRQRGAAIHAQNEGTVDFVKPHFVDRRDAEIEVAVQHLHHIGMAHHHLATDADALAPLRGEPSAEPRRYRRHGWP